MFLAVPVESMSVYREYYGAVLAQVCGSIAYETEECCELSGLVCVVG